MSFKASKRTVIKKLENIDYKYLFLAIWVLMTVYYIIFSGVSSKTASENGRYNILLEKEKKIRLENAILETQIASESALRHISVKAKEMGFGEPKIIYIK